jgi:hypothetical protein
MGLEARRTVVAGFLWQDRIDDYLAAYEGTSHTELARRRERRIDSEGHRVASGIKSAI